MATDPHELRLHVRFDEGDGPTYVLLHGINADAQDWRAIIDTIGPGYRFIAPDLLGFGESPKPADIDYSADDHAAALEATLADLGVTEQFVLVGYSLGGNVAVRYASTYPHRLRRLFLLSTPFYLPAGEYSRAKFGAQYAQGMLFKALWGLVARQKEKEGVAYELASGRLEDFAKAFLRTGDVAKHWDVMSKNLTNTIAAATLVDDLPRLTMPTVFALGVRDPIVRPDQTLALKRLKPDIEIRRIGGLTADHFMLMNIPERVAAEIVRDEVTGLHVAFRAGEGEPIVLLHGLEDTAERWLPVARALARANDVAVLDLLGYGASPAPLSSHYTIADHAAAVLATLSTLYPGRKVRLVGHGIGATIALAAAADRPRAISQVVAFSPAFVPPDTPAADRAAEPAGAAILATRDTFAEIARNERAQRLSSERLEHRIVPRMRSLNAVLGLDAGALMRRVSVPVRFVVDPQDSITPTAWLEELAARDPGRIEVLEQHGGRDVAIEQPVDAVAAIGPVAESQLFAASGMRPVRQKKGTALADLLGGVNATIARHGALMLLGGLPLLLLSTRIPPRLITTGVAIWLLVEAIQAISGSVGLKRGGKAWLPWLVLGIVSVAFAIVLFRREAFAAQVVGWVLAGWALLRGVSALVVARRASETPGKRWLLVAEGVLGVGIAIAIMVVPALGGRLLRWTLGGYLTASGVASLALAYSTHRATKRRIRDYVAGN